MKRGFTLIELLVVVLIIGILAAIALPQYRISVERTRRAQALITIKAVKDSFQRFFLRDDLVTGFYTGRDILDIDLTGGVWEYNNSFGTDMYNTPYFTYNIFCNVNPDGPYCQIDVYRVESGNYQYELHVSVTRSNNPGAGQYCYSYPSNNSDFWKKMCKIPGFEDMT